MIFVYPQPSPISSIRFRFPKSAGSAHSGSGNNWRLAANFTLARPIRLSFFLVLLDDLSFTLGISCLTLLAHFLPPRVAAYDTLALLLSPLRSGLDRTLP